MVTILSVEDNAVNLQLIHRYLKAFDARLVDAATGSEGIQLANAEHPDLILMDIHLPDMNGKDVAACIHDLPQLQNVPIVAITADDTPELRKQCLEEGFDAYLAKPVSVGNLLRVVQNLIGLQGQRIA